MKRLMKIEKPRIPVVICVDTSASMAGSPQRQIEAFLGSVREDFNCGSDLAQRVDACVITFSEKAQLAQDWVPMSSLGEIDLACSGRTNINDAVFLANMKIKEHMNRMRCAGIEARMPFVVLLSDCVDTVAHGVDAAVEIVEQGGERRAIKPVLLACGEVDDKNAAQLCLGNRDYILSVSNFNLYEFLDYVVAEWRGPSYGFAEPVQLVNLECLNTLREGISLPDWLRD